MTSRGKRTKIVLASLLFSVLLLEGAMQLIAWRNWARTEAEHRAESRTGEKTVLCVGDSFTWGMGATTRAGSYPSVLQSKLEQSDPGRFAVLNRGYPGFDSHTILRRLPRQLRDLRPDYVYLLIGYNDRFSAQPEVLPQELDAGATYEGFRWRCRTLDLLRRMGTRLSGSRADTGAASRSRPPEVCGTWHSGSVTFTFREDGHMAVNSVPCRWWVSGEELLVRETPKACTLRWRREGHRLILEGDAFEGGRIQLEPGPAQENLLARARLAIRQGRLESAAQLLDECEPGPATLGARAEINQRQGKQGLFEAQLRELRAMAADSRQARSELARLLIVTGQSEEGVPLARSHLAEQPVYEPLWEALLDLAECDETRTALVADIIDGNLDAIDDSALRGKILSRRAVLRRRLGGDRGVVLEESLAGAFLQNRFDGVVALLKSDPKAFDDGVIAKAKALLGLTPEQEVIVDNVVRQARTGADSVSGRLERHLRMCARLCRQHEAELVLLLYPEPIGLEHVVRSLGQAGLARIVDPQPRFAEERKHREWSELFVPDGHCSDAGYALLAETVFQDLEERAR